MNQRWIVMCAAVVFGCQAWAQTLPSQPAAGGGGGGSIAVLLQKGIYQEETAGDLAAAAQTYRQVIADGTSNRQYTAQALYRLGVVSLKQKQAKDALEAFGRLKSQYPEQKDLVAKAEGQLAEARKNFSEAEVAQVVGDAVSQVSTMAETDPRLPAALATLDGLNDTMVVNELVTELHSQTPDVRRAAIYVLYKGPIKDIGLAVPELEKLLGHEEAFTRGMAALALGTRKVDEDYDKIVNLATKDSAYVRRCAVAALAEMGKPEGKAVVEQIAKQDKDEIVQLVAKQMLDTHWAASGQAPKPGRATAPTRQDKMDAETMAAKGWQLWGARKLPEAEEAFRDAVEKDPTAADAWNGLGWAQLNQGKKENASAAFEKAVSLNPRQAAALNGLGWIAKGNSDAQQAIQYWRRAYAASPAASAAISGLAGAYSENGDYNQAIEWYQRWLKAEPANSEARSGLERATIAQAAVQEALPPAEQWLKLVDDGEYQRSWDQASALFQKRIAADASKAAAGKARAPLGKLLSRKLKSAQYLTSLPGAPDGQYVVIQFDTQFENKKEAVETVTPMKEPDGNWRVSGYYVK